MTMPHKTDSFPDTEEESGDENTSRSVTPQSSKSSNGGSVTGGDEHNAPTSEGGSPPPNGDAADDNCSVTSQHNDDDERSVASGRSSRSRGRSASKTSRSRSGSSVSNRSHSASSVASYSSGSQTSPRTQKSDDNDEPVENFQKSPTSATQSESDDDDSASERKRQSVKRKRSKHDNSEHRHPSNRSESSQQSDDPHESSQSPSDTNNKKQKSDDETVNDKCDEPVDGESNVNNTTEVSAKTIFGDADDISSSSSNSSSSSDEDEASQKDDVGKRVQRKPKSSDNEEAKEDEEDSRRGSSDDDMAEDEKRNDDNTTVKEAGVAEGETVPETRIDVEIPKISCDLGRDVHFIKLPNFLSVETRPFDPDTYEDEIDEEETLDEEGRARLKLKVENTIRWRDEVDESTGEFRKESNTRLVKWSDGSYSLHLGGEIFDVYKQPLQGDHNHLFIRQGTGLQGQAVFRTKLTFRPHSTESFTHRKMTLSLADRSQKTAGIKILSHVGQDPDQGRKFLLKKEEEKLRQSMRMTPRTRKKDSQSRSHTNSNIYREEDGSDEDGAISLNAIKKRYKSHALSTPKGAAIYSSDEDGSDIEARKSRRVDKTKALRDSDSNEDTSS